jgi:hypothetical protein
MAAPAAAEVIVVGPPASARDDIVEVLRRAALSVITLTEAEALGRRSLTPPHLVVLVRGGPRAAREAAQVRLLSYPALHGAPLLVVGKETDVDSYGGALARGAAAYVAAGASPPEVRALAQRLVRGAERRRAQRRADGRDRRGPRRPLLLKVEVEDRVRGTRFSGHIVDVGLSGCRLEVPAPLAKGTAVGLQLHAYRESTGIVLAGSVRWTRAGEDGMHLAAVRFNGTSAVVSRRLFGLR